MKKNIILIRLFVLLIGDITAQVTMHGVTFPAKLGTEGKVCVLNGAGVRKHYFINIYVAGLYLPTKSSDPNAIINADDAIAVRLQIISSLVTQERMTESVKEGFRKATGGNTAPIQKEIDLVLKIFNSEPIKVGDVFDIWYIPGKGIVASKNAKKISLEIPGLTFKKLLYSIWLGKDPVDEGLKDSMLGLPVN